MEAQREAMTDYDFNDEYDDENSMLYRTKWGKLTDAELETVKEKLLGPDTDEDRYLLLYILGRGGDPRFVRVVEPFVDSPENPMLAALALRILCDYRELAEPYRDVMMAFIRGMPWDDERDAKLSALSEAGEWLRTDRTPSCSRFSWRRRWTMTRRRTNSLSLTRP